MSKQPLSNSKVQPVKKPAAKSAPAAAAPQAVSGFTVERAQSGSPADVLALQRSIGNRAVQRVLAKHGIQASLTVGAADDSYEREADRVAQQVMSAPAQRPAVQRHDDDEHGLQRKPLAAKITPLVQRHHLPPPKRLPKEDEEDEQTVRRKASSASDSFQASQRIECKLSAQTGSGGALPNHLRADMEGRFGADFGAVRLHTGGDAVQLSRDLSAHAFTHGRDIYFGAGKYNPSSGDGKRLLAHELTHVVQQTPSVQRKSNRVRGKPISNVIAKKTDGTIQRVTAKQAGKKTWEWTKRIFLGVPAGLVFAAAGMVAGPVMGGIKGYKESKANNRGTGKTIGNVLAGIGGGFVGGFGAGLAAGQFLAHHENAPDSSDVAKGAELPDLGSMNTNLLTERLDKIKTKMRSDKQLASKARTIGDVLTLVDDDTVMKAAVVTAGSDRNKTRALTAKGVGLPDNKHIPIVRAIIKKHYTAADPNDLSKPFSDVTFECTTTKPDGAALNLIGRAFFQAQEAYSAQQVGATVTPQSTGLHLKEQKYFAPAGNKTPEQAFWEDRDKYEMNQAYLSPEDRVAFADALKKLPTVKLILHPTAHGADTRHQTSQWKDGGRLVNNIEEVDDLSKPKKFLSKKRLKSRTFRTKIDRVDNFTRVVVGPELLIQAPRPKIKIHSTAAQDIDAPWGYRANANDEEVNLAYNQDEGTMAHEVGHAVERHLPVKRWHDIHMLLGTRHQAAGGGGAKSGDTPIFTTWTEGRFGGKYVTGKYTSRTYKFGNVAEVVSMAMQYFSDPSKARELIEGDPQHAAIVLRSMRPDEYKSVPELMRFNKFIPHKKKPALPPRPSPEVLAKIKANVARMKQLGKPLPQPPPK